MQMQLGHVSYHLLLCLVSQNFVQNDREERIHFLMFLSPQKIIWISFYLWYRSASLSPDWIPCFQECRSRHRCLENRSIHSLGLAVHGLNVSGVWDGMWLSLSIWARSCGQAVFWFVCILLVFFFFLCLTWWAPLLTRHQCCFVLSILHFNKFFETNQSFSCVCIGLCLI